MITTFKTYLSQIYVDTSILDMHVANEKQTPALLEIVSIKINAFVITYNCLHSVLLTIIYFFKVFSGVLIIPRS